MRIVREDITELWEDSYQPQKMLITMWPIYVIASMLPVPIEGVESVTQQAFKVDSEGGKHILDAPVTYDSEHELEFDYK